LVKKLNLILTHIIDDIPIMCNPSTAYYRKNRESKKIVYQCPHCSYQTSNAKICLLNHINAKHIPERERPFQCHECTRGFAQKAHLDKHLEVCHNITRQKRKVSSVSYIVRLTKMIPRSVKTKARRQYYMGHRVINTNDINDSQHEYLPGVYLKKHDIQYDINKGFIYVDKCNLYKTMSSHKMSKINLRT
jgi:hypothetical protein